MGHGVIPDFVPFGNRLRQNLGMILHHVTDHVEGGLDIAVLEDLEQPRRVLRMRPVIKGDRDDLLVGLDAGVGVLDS